MLTYVLAIVGSGLAGAAVDQTIHHLVGHRRPQAVTLDTEQLKVILQPMAEAAAPSRSEIRDEVEQELAAMPNWQRPDIKMMRDVLEMMSPDARSNMERMALEREERLRRLHGKPLNPEPMEGGRG